MKKTNKTLFRAILCLIIAVCCVLAITSCQFKPKLPTEEELLALEETELAKTLMDTSFLTMDYMDSYTIVAVSDLKISDMTSKSTVTTKMQGWYKGTFALNYSVLNHTSSGRQTEQIKYEFGHESGKTYIVPPNSDVVLWSPQSVKDYISSASEKAGNEDTDFIYTAYEGAGEITAQQNEDKTWTATFTDFSDEWLEKFEGMLDDVKPLYESSRKLKSVTVTLDIDEELRPTELDVSYKFKKKSSASNAVTVSFNYNMKFSNFESTKVSSKTFDEENKIESFDDLDGVINSFETIPKKKSGNINVSSYVKITYKGVEQSESASISLAYENVDKKLSYTMSTSVDGQSPYITTYENGNLTLNGYDAGTSSDSAERSGITSLINAAGLTTINYEKCEITKSGTDTVYKFTLSNPDTGAYSSLANVWDNEHATVEVTVDSQGTLKSYVYILEISKQDISVYVRYNLSAYLTDAN